MVDAYDSPYGGAYPAVTLSVSEGSPGEAGPR